MNIAPKDSQYTKGKKTAALFESANVCNRIVKILYEYLVISAVKAIDVSSCVMSITILHGNKIGHFIKRKQLIVCKKTKYNLRNQNRDRSH